MKMSEAPLTGRLSRLKIICPPLIWRGESMASPQSPQWTGVSCFGLIQPLLGPADRLQSIRSAQVLLDLPDLAVPDPVRESRLDGVVGVHCVNDLGVVALQRGSPVPLTHSSKRRMTSTFSCDTATPRGRLLRSIAPKVVAHHPASAIDGVSVNV